MQEKSKQSYRVIYIFATLLMAMLSACAGTGTPAMDQALLNRLKNSGPVSLSTENPYLAGNVALSKEMTRSTVLKGFIEHRKTPKAIELTQGMFSPLMMNLYYPEAAEFFTFEGTAADGIVQGPFPMDEEKLVALNSLGVSHDDKIPVLELSNASLARDPTILSEQNSTEPAKTIVDSVPFKSPASETTPEVAPVADSLELTLKDLIANQSGHPAELSPKGDLVHYVTLSGETLDVVAKWYTFDGSNTERISRINGLEEGKSLEVGDSIVIPAYLVKNKLRLSEAGVQRLGGVILQ